jgi:hypothetical protein
MNRAIYRLQSRVRRPVRRAGAAYYLLVTLLSFAASVTLTRLFLELTGYPQLGGGGLHIAHVLWGGLLLFVGALAPLVFANRWAFHVSAVLSGVGVGLFIDEVGKFITSTNDYFFPAAAPIIYAFFLLTVLVYLQTRRPMPQDARTALYGVLDALEEVIDHDLDAGERAELERGLKSISQQTEHPELARLANELLEFVAHHEILLAPEQPTLLERWQALLRELEKRPLNRARLRLSIVAALAGLGGIALARLAVLGSTAFTDATFAETLAHMAAAGLVSSTNGMYWFFGRVVLEGVVGVMLIAGAVLLHLGRERRGIRLAYFGLLASLSVVNLLVFYFDQFSTIVLALLQLGALLALIFYRRKYQG